MTSLNYELAKYAKYDADFPRILHPLIHAVPFFDTTESIRLLNRALVAKKQQLNIALDNRNWAQAVFLHERPHRVSAFMEHQASMYDYEYWPLLGEVWTDAESIFPDRMRWWELLTNPRNKRNLFTDCDDRTKLRKLPRRFTIYRGTTHVERHSSYLGFSWTLDRALAERFATRVIKEEERPYIAKAEIRRRDVIGFMAGRGDQEIVAAGDRYLSNVEWEPV